MSVQADSTNFLSLLKKSTKELNSEKFYETMNLESSDLSKYTQKCQKIDVLNNDEQMIKICKLYLRYLENCEELNKEGFGYDVSILFNYWLYDKLTNIYGAKNDSKISLRFANLQYIWDYKNSHRINESYYQKCKPNLNMVHHSDWDKRKKLYDYYVDYSILYDTAKHFNDKCETYYKKIEEKKSLYEYFQIECDPDKNNCPEFYNICKNYSPEKVLPELPCHGKIQKEKAHAIAAESDNPVQQLLRSGEDTMVSADGSGVPGHSNGSQTEVTAETSQTVTKVGQSVLGVAPVLLTATALYRYTPVGSWVRKLGGYKQNSISNMDGEMDEFLSNSLEPGNMFLGNAENYISYQPM
ncbi:PIR protein [Plasmodium ovale]|uniref:PIR Superfamily Protein n=2 Tax=Plasmodium ovale TaxID=36330 RepID=A0A1A8XBR2_PLAOA|nr:PIR Superfamily Protein [Plasmodium ovale curtisi]SBT83085.1 PIR protein [Plasmodium ovale]